MAFQPDLDKTWEVEGAWWLPSDIEGEGTDGSEAADGADATGVRGSISDSQWPAYGAVRYSPRDGLRLRTLGPSADPFTGEMKTFAIWGQVDGRRWSLLDAFEEDSITRIPDGVVTAQTIYANAAVTNAHVRTLDDLVFSEAWLRIAGLHEFLWHGGRGAQLDADTEPNADPEDLVRVVRLPGAMLRFHLAWEGTRGVHRHLRERNAYLQIQLVKPAPFSAWMKCWVSPLRNLVTFATREPARLESIKAVIYDEADERTERLLRVKDPKAFRRRDVQIILPPIDLIRTAPRYSYDRMLVGIAELGDEADRFISRWMDMHEALATGRDVFFASLTSRLYIENELLGLMSAAEAYHRTFHDQRPLTRERHDELAARMLELTSSQEEKALYKAPLRYANQQSQRARLRHLFDRAAGPIPELKPLTKRAVDTVVETRNYYTHLGKRSAGVLEGMALKREIDRLVLVLNLNFLLDLGLPPTLVEQYVRRSYYGSQQAILGPTLNAE